MANGDRNLDNASKQHSGDDSKATGEALLADAQKQPLLKAVEKALSPNAPDAPKEVGKQTEQSDKASDKGDKNADKISEAVTANLANSCKDKMTSLNSTDEGKKLLNQSHDCGQTVTEQWKDVFKHAYQHAGVEQHLKN